MKNIFIIDGAAGTGKTDLIHYLNHKFTQRYGIGYIKKYTTREKRPEEENKGLDLIHIKPNEFNSKLEDHNFYHYSYGKYKYGFFKSDLENSLSSHKNVFIIIRNRPLTEEIAIDFPEVRTVITYIYSDKEQVIKRLETDGYDDESIKFRMNRMNTSWEDYLTYNDIFQEILINNSNRVDFQRLIDWLVKKYNENHPSVVQINNKHQYPLLKSLHGYKGEIQNRLEKYPFEKNVFLMMKFRESNKLIYRFIQKKLEEQGYNCVRADEKEWDITGNVYNPLAVLYCCKYGIALFDEPEKGNNFSPNVAYELGIMHLQQKECLILRHDSLPSMPFDFIKDLHRRYGNDLEVENIVLEWIGKINR